VSQREGLQYIDIIEDYFGKLQQMRLPFIFMELFASD